MVSARSDWSQPAEDVQDAETARPRGRPAKQISLPARCAISTSFGGSKCPVVTNLDRGASCSNLAINGRLLNTDGLLLDLASSDRTATSQPPHTASGPDSGMYRAISFRSVTHTPLVPSRPTSSSQAVGPNSLGQVPQGPTSAGHGAAAAALSPMGGAPARPVFCHARHISYGSTADVQVQYSRVTEVGVIGARHGVAAISSVTVGAGVATTTGGRLPHPAFRHCKGASNRPGSGGDITSAAAIPAPPSPLPPLLQPQHQQQQNGYGFVAASGPSSANSADPAEHLGLLQRRQSRSAFDVRPAALTAAGGGAGRTLLRFDSHQRPQPPNSSRDARRRRSCNMGLPPQLVAISDYLASTHNQCNILLSSCSSIATGSGTAAVTAGGRARRMSHLGLRERGHVPAGACRAANATATAAAAAGAASPNCCGSAVMTRPGSRSSARNVAVPASVEVGSFSFIGSCTSLSPVGGADPRKTAVTAAAAPAPPPPPAPQRAAAQDFLSQGSSRQLHVAGDVSRSSGGRRSTPPQLQQDALQPDTGSRSSAAQHGKGVEHLGGAAAAATCVPWLKGVMTEVGISGGMEGPPGDVLPRADQTTEAAAGVRTSGNRAASRADGGRCHDRSDPGAATGMGCGSPGERSSGPTLSARSQVAGAAGAAGGDISSGEKGSRSGGRAARAGWAAAACRKLARKWGAVKSSVTAALTPLTGCSGGAALTTRRDN